MDGKIQVCVDKANIATSDEPASAINSWKIETTAEECSWNLHASRKPLKWDQVLGRSSLVSACSNGCTIKVGSKIFCLKANNVELSIKAFSPKDFSLLLDHFEQQGRYLFVTSRQKVLEVPAVEDESPTDTKVDEKDDKAEKQILDATNAKDSTDTPIKDAPEDSDVKTGSKDSQENDASSKDDKTATTASDSESDETNGDSETSVADEELSAYESWSEASTDLEEAGIRRVADIGPFPVPLPVSKKVDTQSSDTESTCSSSDESHHSCCETSSSSDNESVSGTNARYAKEAEDEEEDRMIDMIYFEDRDGPGWGNSDSQDDQEPEGAWSDTGYGMFNRDADFDGFVAIESDSEDCSECGDDGGKACPLLGDDDNDAAEKDGEEENKSPSLLGAPLAQVHVYDTSTSSIDENGNMSMKRLFRFQQPTQFTPLHDSPLAVHPTNSLLVWPVGTSATTKSCSSLLFADYKHNTYFLKKLRFSRLFSQHASVQCRFSTSGEYLHVAALEKLGEPPKRVRRPKKSKKKSKAKPKVEKKKEAPSYELIVSTYRMSEGKTTRAPPVLVHQVQNPLGRIPVTNALPTYTWSKDQVFVTYASEGELKICQIDLQPAPRRGKAMRDEYVRIKKFAIENQQELAEKELHCLLPEAGKDDSEHYKVLALEPPNLKPFIKPKEETEKQKEEAKPEEGNKPTSKPAETSSTSVESTDNTIKTDESVSEAENTQTSASSSEPTKEIIEKFSSANCIMEGAEESTLRIVKLVDLLH